ncbi:MAG: DUF1285 domain-containing protein [Hyphomonadaceae bacterium]|nr:DUF1285 domain-containing protein [Hyphomonadaceae bacterium]
MAEMRVNSSGNIIPSLEQVLREIVPDAAEGRKLPPVHLWHPEHCGDIGMEIRADGSWWHDGTRIGREKLVRLFSTILRKDEDGETYLVTPYEKVIVRVEDAPFLAVRVDRVDDDGVPALLFTTNLGDTALAGPGHPLRVETDSETQEPAPYVLIRGALEAKLTRPVFYELAGMVEPDPEDPGMMGVWSQGEFYRIGPAEA